MKLTNIGGATAILEHRGKRMLFDPWLNEGILYGSWYHFPPLKPQARDLGRLDYIYISHIHEDHCAAGTIEHLNRDAEVIILHREPKIKNYILSFLKKHRFHFKKIHLIAPYTPTEIEPGLCVDLVEGPEDHEYSYWVDSGLILKWDDFVLYNGNDCPPCEKSLRYIKTAYKRLDLALLSYACGSGYPNCYLNLSHEDKLREKKRIYELGMRRFMEAVKFLDPIKVMPFADQYVIAGSRSGLNRYSPHPACPGAVLEPMKKESLEKKLLLLNSGQAIDFTSNKLMPEEPYHFFTEDDRERYIEESLKDKRYDHEVIQFSDSVPLDRMIKSARQRLWESQKKQEFFPKYYLSLDVPDRGSRFLLALDRETIEEVPLDSNLPQPFLRIIGSSTLFGLMLINHISWNMADGAFFFDYERMPNTYDPKIYAMINLLTV